MNPISTNELSESFKNTLSAATQRPVGLGEAPTSFKIHEGYYVLYAIPIDGYWDSLAPFGGEADLVYQVTSVGKSSTHCEWLADRARLCVLARVGDGPAFQVAFTPPAGLTVVDRRPADGLPGTPAPEGTSPNQRWSVAERFVFSVTSS